MAKPVKIDLRNLTKRKLSMAEPHCGTLCEYAAPCIIGTLIPPKQRVGLDCIPDDTTIRSLNRNGVVEVAEGQLIDAVAMQKAFDEGNWSKVEKIAQPYLEQQAA